MNKPDIVKKGKALPSSPPGRKVVNTPNPMHRQHHSHFLGIRSHTSLHGLDQLLQYLKQKVQRLLQVMSLSP